MAVLQDGHGQINGRASFVTRLKLGPKVVLELIDSRALVRGSPVPFLKGLRSKPKLGFGYYWFTDSCIGQVQHGESGLWQWRRRRGIS